MAYCVNCGKEISAQAVMCPQCGHPGPAAATSATPTVHTGGRPLASWGSRVGAMLLDTLVLAIPFLILAAILFATADVDWQEILDDDAIGKVKLTSDDIRALGAIGLVLLAMILVTMLYKPLMEGTSGQTLGKKWVGIRVVRSEDGDRITMGRAFLRWFFSTLFGIVSLLNFINWLWPLWDDNKQTLHDKAAKTVVVRV